MCHGAMKTRLNVLAIISKVFGANTRLLMIKKHTIITVKHGGIQPWVKVERITNSSKYQSVLAQNLKASNICLLQPRTTAELYPGFAEVILTDDK